jgi:hypothetical protein
MSIAAQAKCRRKQACVERKRKLRDSGGPRRTSKSLISTVVSKTARKSGAKS